MKKKVGFLLPEPLIDALDQAATGLNSKEKWIAVSAAILMFLEASEEERVAAMRRVNNAGFIGGSFADLVEQAKARHAPEPPPTRGRVIPPPKAAPTPRPPR